jgi:hypothetical protein
VTFPAGGALSISQIMEAPLSLCGTRGLALVLAPTSVAPGWGLPMLRQLWATSRVAKKEIGTRHTGAAENRTKSILAIFLITLDYSLNLRGRTCRGSLVIHLSCSAGRPEDERMKLPTSSFIANAVAGLRAVDGDEQWTVVEAGYMTEAETETAAADGLSAVFSPMREELLKILRGGDRPGISNRLLPEDRWWPQDDDLRPSDREFLRTWLAHYADDPGLDKLISAARRFRASPTFDHSSLIWYAMRARRFPRMPVPASTPFMPSGRQGTTSCSNSQTGRTLSQSSGSVRKRSPLCLRLGSRRFRSRSIGCCNFRS